jgi:hypothetical protein
MLAIFNEENTVLTQSTTVGITEEVFELLIFCINGDDVTAYS